MAFNFPSRLTSLLRSAQGASSQAENPRAGQSTSTTVACAQLQGLWSLALPGATAGSSKPPSDPNVPESSEMSDQAARRVRRQGVFGPKTPVSAERSAPVPASNRPGIEPADAHAERDPSAIERTLRRLEGLDVPECQVNEAARPVSAPIPSMTELALQAAFAGTSKMRFMRSPERDHIMKMLEANDVPGLGAVTSCGNNPLRSYMTGLRIGHLLLDKYGAHHFSSALGDALQNLKDFYEANPALVALGDGRAFSYEKARPKKEVERIKMAFAKADELLAALEQAHKAEG